MSGSNLKSSRFKKKKSILSTGDLFLTNMGQI